MTSTGPMLARRHGGSMPTPTALPTRSAGRARGHGDGSTPGLPPRPTVSPTPGPPRFADAPRPAEPRDPVWPRPVVNIDGSAGPFWSNGHREPTGPVGPLHPVEQVGPGGGLAIPIPAGFRPEGDLSEFPTPGGISDALLGGTSHRRADRRFALQLLLAWPEASAAAHVINNFLVRAVRFAARNGVDQFLALGGVLPVEPIHEIACAVAPGCQTVYVEPSQPPVTRPMPEVPANQAAVVRADITRPAEVLGHPGVHARLNVERPVALVAVPGMPQIDDHENPRDVLLGYREATARGSLLIFSQLCDEGSAHGLRGLFAGAGMPGYSRSHAQTVELVNTWEPIEPGLVPAEEWHAPDERQHPHIGRIPVYASIGWH